MRITYFTGGARERLLSAILAAGHLVEEVFANDPGRWPKVSATLALAEGLGIPVTIIRRKDDLSKHQHRLTGRICLSAGYAYLFDKKFLETVAVCINVHGSLLPKYAGARTLFWAIERGDSESGVTVHVVDESVDGGPIILQKRFSLEPFETAKSLMRKTLAFEPQVVVEALKVFADRGLSAAVAQPGRPQLDPNRTPAHSCLDARRPLIDLFDAIRAADPDAYPAHFIVKGEKVCIRIWRPDKPPGEEDLV